MAIAQTTPIIFHLFFIKHIHSLISYDMHLFEYLFLFGFHDGRIFRINVVITKQMKHAVYNQKCKFTLRTVSVTLCLF